MRKYVNRKLINIPVGSDGKVNTDEVRRKGRIPTNRDLVLRLDDGSNFLVNPGEHIPAVAQSDFMDIARTIRGINE
jgi:hypothetical protein